MQTDELQNIDPFRKELIDCGWLPAFDKAFHDEMDKRLNQKTMAAIGPMRLFVWCGDWFAEEVVKRQRYKVKIYDETSIEVLSDPEFKKRVSGVYSYYLTGNDGEIAIFNVKKAEHANA